MAATTTVPAATDEQIAALDKLLGELRSGVKDGSLLHGPTIDAVQQIIDGNSGGPLLEHNTTTHLEAVKRFVAADAFQDDPEVGGRTWRMAANFRKHFLGVVEENIPARDVSSWTLLKGSRDPSILEVLGDKAEISLAHLYRLIQLGTSGPAHFGGYLNIAYVRSPIDHKLRAVRWYVYDNKIDIGVREITGPGELKDGPIILGG